MGTDSAMAFPTLNVIELKQYRENKKRLKTLETNVWEYLAICCEIRDERQFRDEYKTWEEFCDDRTPWGKRHTDRLIGAWQAREDGIEMGHNVPNEVDTPGFWIELGQLEQPGHVLEMMIENDEEITTKAIKQKVKAEKPVKPKPDPWDTITNHVTADIKRLGEMNGDEGLVKQVLGYLSQIQKVLEKRK